MPALPDESSTQTPCIHYGTKKVNRRTAAAPASAVSIYMLILPPFGITRLRNECI